MGVLMVLSFSTTRQTSELPIKLIATMTEHREIITLDTMMIHSCIVGVCCPIGKKKDWNYTSVKEVSSNYDLHNNNVQLDTLDLM